jgi:tetratricopeptide (TPR) repeat protein
VDFRRVAELVPDNPWVYNDVGNALHALGEHEDAVEAYSQAIALATDDGDRALFHRNRADSWIEIGDHDEAEADCQQALALAPEHPYSHGRQGEVDLAQGRFDTAEERFQRALELGEQHIWHIGLSAALAGLGRAEEARAQLELALEDADADDLEDVREKLQHVADQVPEQATLVRGLLALIDRVSSGLPG